MKRNIPFVRKIHLGVFIADRKMYGKSMERIKEYFVERGYTLYWFDNKYRSAVPMEEWPCMDVVLSFFSKGIDFLTIQKYAAQWGAVGINDIDKQFLLLDRRLVMEVLEQAGVPVPERVTYNTKHLEEGSQYAPQGGAPSASEEISCIVERELVKMKISPGKVYAPSRGRSIAEGVLVVDDQRIEKPYVEKPVYTENHNINVYYGSECRERKNGVCILFRKVGSTSSRFESCESLIQSGKGVFSYRDDGHSYIYEKLVKIRDYQDIKVYMAGSRVYAEARKSPIKDGIVIRNKEGKEERQRVFLSKEEKEAVNRVRKVFQQFICGMDLIRAANGRFFIIDVNGWSFVKSNLDYYKHGNLKGLNRAIKRKVRRKEKREESMYKERSPGKKKTPHQDAAEIKEALKEFSIEEIEVQGVHVVYRHGSRVPKMKKKLVFVSEKLAAYIAGKSLYAGRDTARIKEIAALLEAEQAEENAESLSLLKEVMQRRKADVRVKFYPKPDNITKVVLKWGGALTRQAYREIEYEAMEYEGELASLVGDSVHKCASTAPKKAVSGSLTERKVQIVASMEERTAKTAEVFAKVLSWTGRALSEIQERQAVQFGEVEGSSPLSFDHRLSQAYTVLKEQVLLAAGRRQVSTQLVQREGPGEDRALHNQFSIVFPFRESEGGREGSEGRDSVSVLRCSCPLDIETSSVPYCEEHSLLERWCFLFNEYPFLTEGNYKTLVPVLLDFYHCDLLQMWYLKKHDLFRKYFGEARCIFKLFSELTQKVFLSRVQTFFKINPVPDIALYFASLLGAPHDTLYVAKKLSIQIFLKYILSLEDPEDKHAYTNTVLAKRAEENIHRSGFLSSIEMVHFVYRGTSYLMFKYSQGLEEDLYIPPPTRAQAPALFLLKTKRKSILKVIRSEKFLKSKQQ
ncbi:inositol-hexakisphosphate/diphosphoinositol-pentakisphosphate 1-kinase [Nematocida sp. AWRm77]|nr:inositol-hexakisphosphate/diphosphoinositol-pentakisphosphate 1-kinase [Nematocida sp. AWRm77]